MSSNGQPQSSRKYRINGHFICSPLPSPTASKPLELARPCARYTYQVGTSCLLACLSLYQWRPVAPLVREQPYDMLGWPRKLETMVLLWLVVSSAVRIVDRVQYQDLCRSHFAIRNKSCSLMSTIDWKSCLLHLNENETSDRSIIFLVSTHIVRQAAFFENFLALQPRSTFSLQCTDKAYLCYIWSNLLIATTRQKSSRRRAFGLTEASVPIGMRQKSGM